MHWEIKTIVHGTLKCCQGNSAVTLQLCRAAARQGGVCRGEGPGLKIWVSCTPQLIPSHEEEGFLGCSHEGNRERRAHLGVCGGARGAHGCCSQH